MRPQELEAIADTLIQEKKVLLDDIKATGQGVYVALCNESTKDREPYKGAAHTALTTIARSLSSMSPYHTSLSEAMST